MSVATRNWNNILSAHAVHGLITFTFDVDMVFGQLEIAVQIMNSVLIYRWFLWQNNLWRSLRSDHPQPPRGTLLHNTPVDCSALAGLFKLRRRAAAGHPDSEPKRIGSIFAANFVLSLSIFY